MQRLFVYLAAGCVLLYASLAAAEKAPVNPIDLNLATEVELTQLPGVGVSRAAAIARYRATHPFRRTTDLMRVKGFGRKTFARVKPFIVVQTSDSSRPGVTATSPVAPTKPTRTANDSPAPGS